MIADEEFVKRKFREFNQLMFDNLLPEIPIYLSDAKTFLGKCCYKKKVFPEGRIECFDFLLKINTRIDLPERKIEDTIIHEMIHYFIAYKNLKDTSTHGVLFKQIMNGINERFGRNLTVSYKSKEREREALVDKKQRYHVIAVVDFHDGRFGIKVLPRILPRILFYYNSVIVQEEVASVSLYMSNDVFFNRFPTSSALRVHYADAEEVMAHLKDAEVLGCDGKNVTRNK